MSQLNLTLSNVRRSLSSGWQDASQRMIEELQNSLNRQREIVSLKQDFLQVGLLGEESVQGDQCAFIGVRECVVDEKFEHYVFRCYDFLSSLLLLC